MFISRESLLQILVPCVIALFIYLLYKKYTRSIDRCAAIAIHNCKPPTAYPQKSFFAVAESRTPSACQIQSHLRYGNSLSTKVFANVFWFKRPVISTTEPDNVEAVLFTHFADYCVSTFRKESFAPVFGGSFFLKDGTKWKHVRSLLQLCMAKSRGESLRMFEVHLENLIQAFSKQESGTIDLAIWFPRLIADITTEFLFGKSMGAIEKPDSSGVLRALHEALEICEDDATLGPPNGGGLQLEYWNNLSDNVKNVHDFIDQKVRDRIKLPGFAISRQNSGSLEEEEEEEEEEGTGSFLDELCNLTDDKKFLRDESLTIFSATVEPVSALLTNLFLVLAKRPDLWEILRGEVGSLEGRKPGKRQLQAMKYHQFCLKESLRLRPVRSSISREAHKDTMLPRGGGPDGNSPIFVTEGTTIALSIAAMHRRKDLWGEDADEFRPERWINEKPSWKFIPFSGGPRVCLGQDFAMDMATYILVRLVQNFQSIEGRDTWDRPENAHLGFTSQDRVQVVMKAG